jgi:hypothetical protein
MTETQLAKPSTPPSEAELAKRINETLSSMGSAFRSSISRALELGDLLRQAKDRVGHGRFENWLKNNCQLSFSTARRYMKYSENRTMIESKIKSVNVTDLNLSDTPKMLSAPREGGGEDSSGGSSSGGRRELTKQQKLKQVETFTATWEKFEDWQRRSFLKPIIPRVRELIEEVENEVAEKPEPASSPLPKGLAQRPA